MKDTTFSIRISKGDLETIKAKAKQAKLSQSDYVTRCCLGKRVLVMDEMKEILKQQKAIGRNLNQLTTLANMGRIMVIDLQNTKQELENISQLLQKIMKK